MSLFFLFPQRKPDLETEKVDRTKGESMARSATGSQHGGNWVNTGELSQNLQHG